MQPARAWHVIKCTSPESSIHTSSYGVSFFSWTFPCTVESISRRGWIFIPRKTMLAALLGLCCRVGITQNFLQYAILFYALNSKSRVSQLFPRCFDRVHSQNISSFTSAMGAPAGLPPRFCAGRKSAVNDLRSWLYILRFRLWHLLANGRHRAFYSFFLPANKEVGMKK